MYTNRQHKTRIRKSLASLFSLGILVIFASKSIFANASYQEVLEAFCVSKDKNNAHYDECVATIHPQAKKISKESIAGKNTELGFHFDWHHQSDRR